MGQTSGTSTLMTMRTRAYTRGYPGAIECTCRSSSSSVSSSEEVSTSSGTYSASFSNSHANAVHAGGAHFGASHVARIVGMQSAPGGRYKDIRSAHSSSSTVMLPSPLEQ